MGWCVCMCVIPTLMSDIDFTETARAKKELAYLRARLQSEYQQLMQIREDVTEKLSSPERGSGGPDTEEIERLHAEIEELQVTHKKQVDQLQNQIEKLKDQHEEEVSELQEQLQDSRYGGIL